MKKNKLRELLNAGKPSVGIHMMCNSLDLVEAIGLSDAFDYIEFCGEYATWTIPDLDNFARTVELFPNMSSMMKVEAETRTHIAARSVDCGIQNLLFADCHSLEDVKECLNVVKPDMSDGGKHGNELRRNTGYFLESGSPEWIQSLKDVVVALMIEKKPIMEHLEEILSLDRVDMLQFGPGDFQLSLGKPRAARDEAMKAQRDMIELALKKGKHPRVEIGSFEQAKEYIDMGVRHFCVGTDLSIIYQWSKKNGEEMRKLLS